MPNLVKLISHRYLGRIRHTPASLKTIEKNLMSKHPSEGFRMWWIGATAPNPSYAICLID